MAERLTTRVCVHLFVPTGNGPFRCGHIARLFHGASLELEIMKSYLLSSNEITGARDRRRFAGKSRVGFRHWSGVAQFRRTPAIVRLGQREEDRKSVV